MKKLILVASATLLDFFYLTYNTDDDVLLSTYSSTYNILLGILLGGCRLDVDLELVFALEQN